MARLRAETPSLRYWVVRGLGSTVFLFFVGGVSSLSAGRFCDNRGSVSGFVLWDDGGVRYSGGGDKEPIELRSELRSEVNSEQLGLFMVMRSARAQRSSRP